MALKMTVTPAVSSRGSWVGRGSGIKAVQGEFFVARRFTVRCLQFHFCVEPHFVVSAVSSSQPPFCKHRQCLNHIDIFKWKGSAGEARL